MVGKQKNLVVSKVNLVCPEFQSKNAQDVSNGDNEHCEEEQSNFEFYELVLNSAKNYTMFNLKKYLLNIQLCVSQVGIYAK